MTQVRRQDQLGFQQRKSQAEQDNGHDLGKDTPHALLEEHRGHKRDHRGQHAEYRRHSHPPHSPHDAVDPLVFLLKLGVGAFRGDDAVIHQHPQYQDKTEHRHDIDGNRQTQCVDRQQGAQHGEGHAEHYPECQ